MNYRDFDLSIRRQGRKYLAQAQGSEAGEAALEFALPFTEDKIENLLLKLYPSRQHVRGLATADAVAIAKELGGGLYRSVFQGEIASCLMRCIEKASSKNERVRIRLRLSDVPELSNLPWEYLYDEQRGRFLALSYKTSLVRYINLPEEMKPLEVKPPLRALVMIASPQDYAALDVEAEWGRISEIFSSLSPGFIVWDRLEQASLPALREQLQHQSYHIFHYIGHGGFDRSSGKSVLVLEDEYRNGVLVEGEKLGRQLHNHPSLRLAILNACEGASATSEDLFSGIAQSLIREEVPAVIGMQFEITDRAAITFGGKFYDSIMHGNPVDAAMLDARLAIDTEPESGVEWGTPVLYLRAQNGNLFNIKALPQAETFAVIIPSDVQPASKLSPTLPGSAPTGTLSSKSPFYIERAAEKRVVELVQETGITLTIIKPGQSGGSSLVSHLRQAATKAGKHTAYLSFQQFSREDFAASEKFFYSFCVKLTRLLKAEDRVEAHWERYRNVSSGERCTYYVQNLLQAMGGQALFLAMDEIDRLAGTNFKSDFFAMLRNWHNDRAMEPDFERLDLVLITSLELHQLIDDPYQSPFNVGVVERFDDFTADEVMELSTRYGLQLNADHVAKLMSLLGGHPLLHQHALHHIAKTSTNIEALIAQARKADGTFHDLLESLYATVNGSPLLLQGVRSVLSKSPMTEDTILQLRRAGLVQRQGNRVQFRCRLYEEYFREQFHL